ncbi:PDE12 phosphodiesterase, partial [Pygoscelis papua]
MWRRLRSAFRRLRGSPAAFLVGGGRLPAARGAMERAVVRCVPSEPKLSLRFVLPDGSAKHMQRDQAEPLGRALARIATNAAKGHAKAAKKSKKARAEGGPAGEAAAAAPAVRLFSRDGEAVAEEVPNAAAWQDGAVLQIGEARYRVERNPPALTELQLPRSLLAGFPVCPKVSAEFAAPQHCLFRWYREQRPAAGGGPAGDGGPAWVEAAAAERVFTPSNALIICAAGTSFYVHSSPLFPLSPGRCSQARFVEHQTTGEGRRRINSLKHRQNSGIFRARYRWWYWLPSFSLLTLICQNMYLIKLKSCKSVVNEIKLIWLALIMPLYKVIVGREIRLERFVSLLMPVGLPAELSCKYKRVRARSTYQRFLFLLKVSVLQSTTDPSRKICVANTHLYWHPKGGNIRLIQIAVALSHIKHVACDLYPSIPIVFCGDFNSTPSSGTYSFINSGGIAEDHEDWVSNGEEERCNMPLSHSFKLLSACGEPAYTNYVGGFHGCLDYIFIDKNALEVEQVIPLPSHEEVTTHQALPSVSHPSDHIALICDLKWK